MKINSSIQLCQHVGRVAALLGYLAIQGLIQSVYAVEPGNSAPDIKIESKEQTSKKLSDLKGKVVYLDFWASWCGPCKQSFPWLNEMQQKYGKQGFQVLGINVDQQHEDMQQFLAMTPAQFLISHDPQGVAPAMYGIPGMPTSVLIDRDGKVLMVHKGFRVAEAAEIEQSIKQALGLSMVR